MILPNVYGDRLQKDFEGWLYGPWDEDKYRKFTFLYAIPGVRDYLDYLLDSRADQEYLVRYGMDYSDIHDPRKLRGTASSSRFYGSTYRMISRNVEKLYR